jgi:hypothetical protein
MINDILIIDDIVPKSYQDEIEEIIFNNDNNFNWFLLKDVTTDGNTFNNIGFNHVFKKENGNITSNFLTFFMPMIYIATEKINVKYNNIIKARTFLQTPRNNKLHNIPHVDLKYPHLVFLYYVNDSDGDTILFKETLEDTPNPKDDYFFNQKQVVSPKKGRGLLFNGNRYHASSNPTKIPRCVINFDLN